MFISKKRYNAEIDKAYMRGYEYGKTVGKMDATRKNTSSALRKKTDFYTSKEYEQISKRIKIK